MEDQRDHAEEAANAAAVRADQLAELRAQRFVITGEDRQTLQDAAALITGRLRNHVAPFFVWRVDYTARRLQSAELLAAPDDGWQHCERCSDRVHALSSRGWCDGCEAESPHDDAVDGITRALIHAEVIDHDVELLLATGQTVRGIVVVDFEERPGAVAVYPWKFRPTQRQELPTIVRLSAIVAVVPVD